MNVIDFSGDGDGDGLGGVLDLLDLGPLRSDWGWRSGGGDEG